MSAVGDCLTALADAVRARLGITKKMRLDEMPHYIERIEGDVYSPDKSITDWGYFSYNNRHNDRVARLLYSDTENGSSFAHMFDKSTELTYIPDLSTSKGINFSYMFYDNKALLKSPSLSTWNGENFSYMYNACVSMTETPVLNLRNAKYLNYMFWNCQAMKGALSFVMNEAVEMEGFVRNSYLLSSLHLTVANPFLLSNTTAMCHSCHGLKEVTGTIPTGKSGAAGMFCGCDALQRLETMRINTRIPDDATDVWKETFDWCYELTDLEIKGTNKWSGLNLKHSKKLSKDSIACVINTLSDSVSGKSITLSCVNVDNAFADTGGSAGQEWQELIATKPNWTIVLV